MSNSKELWAFLKYADVSNDLKKLHAAQIQVSMHQTSFNIWI